MLNIEKILKFKDNKFKRLIGVNKDTFYEMYRVYKNYEIKRDTKKKSSGRKRKLSSKMKVFILLDYYRNYHTMGTIGMFYEVDESMISRVINEVENVLVDHFTLPGKRYLSENKEEIEYISIDVVECKVQRPKNSSTQKKYYSGKKNFIL